MDVTDIFYDFVINLENNFEEEIKKHYPNIKLKVKVTPLYTLKPFELFICEEGNGDIVPVLRAIPYYIETNGDEIVVAGIELCYCSPYRDRYNVPYGIAVWDSITDEEVFAHLF